jgi:hypothetical protein
MTNAFGVELDSESMRWAAAEGVSETVIAAVLLLHERCVDEIASKLRPDELKQVIKLVGRCPSSYPTGALDALKARCPERPSASPRTKPPAEGQPGHTPRTDHPRRLEAHTPVGVINAADARPLERASGADARQTTGERTNGEKSGTRIGMVDETARRRLIVEDLMKAGLSVRMISCVTDIPRSSVHRAMRAIARAEAKRQIAMIEIASAGRKTASPPPRATMTKKSRVTTKASKAGCRSAGGLRRKLGEDFLANLNRSWELHGREILDSVRVERPELYFKVLVKLTLALHRVIREPTDFDRGRNREEVLRRLEARIADARTLPEQLKAGHEPGRSTKPW